MQHGVGGAAQDGDQHHRVFKCLAGHDVARLDVLFEKIADGGSGSYALVEFQGIFGGGRRTVGQGHAEHLDGRGHGVGGVHASAGARAGDGVADDIATLGFIDVAGEKFAVALEGGDNVEFFMFRGAAGADGASVDHQAGAIEASHGHDAAGHVLIAAGDGDGGVVPLAAHDGFDGIGDQVARLERKAHAVGAHGDAVADADGVEAHADEARGFHSLFYFRREVEQVHVARIAFEPDAGDADLRFGQISLSHAGGVEHGLGGALRFWLGDVGGVFV